MRERARGALTSFPKPDQKTKARPASALNAVRDARGVQISKRFRGGLHGDPDVLVRRELREGRW